MAWLPGIIIVVALSSYVQPSDGTVHKNHIYKDHDIVSSLCEKIVYHFKECGLLKGQQETEAKEGLNDVILYTQGKKVNKRKHALASKLAEIICDSIDANNFQKVLKSAVHAITAAFKNIKCKPDGVFIVAIKDMATEMYNADIKEAIIEAEENIIAARKKAAAVATAVASSTSQTTTTQASGSSSAASSSAAAASSAASSTSQTTTTHVSSAASAAASSSASAASSVNYMSIQSAVATSMASSSVMVGFRDRHLSSSDLISAIIRCLCKFGVQQSLAQSIAYRYCSSVTASSSAQVISNCIGSCVYQALSQSNVVQIGQEGAVSKRICSYILNYLRQCILKHRPAHYPYPGPYPGSMHSGAASSAAAAAASSAASSTSTTTTHVSSAASAAASSSASAASQISSVSSLASSHLMSSIAKRRISNVKNLLALNGISSTSVSTALSQALNLIRHDSNLAKSEVLVEALLETLVAICQVISPTSMISGSSMSESIIKAIG